jgi:hypothetical protein
MWYLAAPFFNPAQVKLVEDIEKAFEDNGVGYFSPRKCDENKMPGPLSEEGANAIYERNVKGIFQSHFVLAVVDWKMPDKQQVRPVKVSLVGMNSNMGEVVDPIGGPLNIPDSGVVWELGFTACINEVLARNGTATIQDPLGMSFLKYTPVLLFTERPPDAALNLMLTRPRSGVKGVVRGLPDLDYLLNKGKFRWNLIVPWTGKNR